MTPRGSSVTRSTNRIDLMSDDASSQEPGEMKRILELAGVNPAKEQEDGPDHLNGAQESQYLITHRIKGDEPSNKGSYDDRIKALQKNLEEICPNMYHDATSSWIISTPIKQASQIRQKISDAIDERID